MTILGIDISKWDGEWDATKAKQAGATFVYIKASQAMVTDPKFLANWQKAKEAGLLRGAYHYLDYTKAGMDQANYFAELLKNDPGELPPVIDYELRRSDNNPSAALGFLRDCLDHLTKRSELFEDATIKLPMIYTGPQFWTEYGDQTQSDYWIQFPLWNAHWTSSSTPLIPLPWTMWHFWQFTSKGPGDVFGSESLTMDMNRFNGTLNELMEFAGIRIPVVNLCELFETLDEKVESLEGTISSINKTGYANISSISSRVDNLEGKMTNSCASITSLTTTLTQQLEAIEQKITNLGNSPTDSFATATPPLASTITDNPSVDPKVPVAPAMNPPNTDNPPSDPAGQVTPTLDPPITDNPLSNPPVQDNPPGDPPNATNAPSSNITYATCITSALNVRSGPGVSYPMVAGLRYGQTLKVINRQNGWAQFENPAGWSSEAYLSFEQTNLPTPIETPQPNSTPESPGICNTSGLNVRSGPGVTFPIVGGLTYGQRIRILGHKNGWAQIETPPGWCNESYLSFA